MSVKMKQIPLDFAVIGHQDNWGNIESFMNGIRKMDPLSIDKIKDTYAYIPPRSVFKMKIKSKTGSHINGVYIESFIDPDKLGVQYTRANLKKVIGAINNSQKLNAKITALGGFTSIVLEGNTSTFSVSKMRLTTGNSLTSAYILKGVEKAAKKLNIDIHSSQILIIGATGDIGIACVNYLKSQVKKLLLCARNENRLKKYTQELVSEKVSVESSISLDDLIPKADIIISVASSKDIEIKHCKKGVLICDAGYPKNIESKISHLNDAHVFHGGMGKIYYGYEFIPDYTNIFYKYPSQHIAHGCALEAVVLAFENKIESYSIGKGNITRKKIEEIYSLSIKHGIEIAPFYNTQGLW